MCQNTKIALYDFTALKYNTAIQTKHAPQGCLGKGEKGYEKVDRYDVGTVGTVQLLRRLQPRRTRKNCRGRLHHLCPHELQG